MLKVTMTTFVFYDEDHTLGNLLRTQLLTNPSVDFAAYKSVHPLKREIEVYVDSQNPEEALLDAATTLRTIVHSLHVPVT